MKTAPPVVLGAAAAVILLAACSSSGGSATPEASSSSTAGPAVTAPDATGSSSSQTPAATAPSSSTSSQPSATADPVPTALPTAFADVNQTITDSDLKDTITVTRIARELPWPAGYKASAQAYELIAVEMKWTPSTDYTIPIRKQDFTITTNTQFPNRPDPLVDDMLRAAGWVLLPDSVDKGDPVTGVVVFKIDPRKAPKLVLNYTRPAVQVTSGGSGSFPAKTFNVTIAG